MTQFSQISAGLSGKSVTLHGLPLDLGELCGANFIFGSTGCGKTETVIEPLTLALAESRMDSPVDRSAIVVFACKGESHLRLLDKLPAGRRRDVIRIGVGAKLTFPLFLNRHWSDRAERTAIVPFITELARRACSTPDELGQHKAYFESLLEGALASLSIATVKGPVDWTKMAKEDLEVAYLFHADALTALVRRIEVAIDHAMARPNAEGPTGLAKPEPTVLERWCDRLDFPSRRRVAAMLRQLAPGNTASGGVLLAELNALVRLFRSGPARDLLICGRNPIAATWERVIHEGLIVVIDLPAAGSPENRTCLLALAQSLMGTILRRTRATTNGAPINISRPVIIVADEWQYLCSKGRHEGLDLFLGSCREFGAIALLATQSVSQLQSVYGHWTKVESLLSHTRHAFIGNSNCALTAQWAETICGLKSATTRPLLIDWHGDPQVAALRENYGSGDPLVSRRDIAALRTGMFYARNPGGAVILADARREHLVPRLKTLQS